MRVICRQNPAPLAQTGGVSFSLFAAPEQQGVGSVGATIPRDLRREGVYPSTRAWDFLALSLSVAAADSGCLRSQSPDGWTRNIQLEVAVTEPDLWNTQARFLDTALRFLTGDIWELTFVPGGMAPPRARRHTRRRLDGDCACLLSGGVDSLVGAIDAVASGRRPVLVSQISQGDAERQHRFAKRLGENLSHLQLNHDASPPGEAERSQRARSIVFIAYGVLASSVLPLYRRGDVVDLLIPENGFISLNIPLTPLRIGTLSTRTTHPLFIRQMQNILDALGLNVHLSNPYQFKTKGEMLHECQDQSLLRELAFQSTSCGRFMRFGYQHCGRCVPCLVRRSAFLKWGNGDGTDYRYHDLSIADSQHRDFDDVRSVVFAAYSVEQLGVEDWAGDTLNQVRLGDPVPYTELAERGMDELRSFLDDVGAI